MLCVMSPLKEVPIGKYFAFNALSRPRYLFL